MKNRITSDKITKLKKNEIVLVGTNSKGNHAGGFAKFCKEKLKLKEGISRGISGQCYAIDTMSGIDVIKEQIQPFIDFAKNNQDKTFLVTLIGCGIAGFTPEQIAPLFKEAKEISNIHLPQSFWDILNKEVIVYGFKGFDKDMKCRNFQYEFGKEYIHKGKVKHCEEGFHFCENPLDIFGYYPPSKSRFSSVTGKGKISKDNQDSKVAVSDLKIEIEMTLKQVIEKGIEVIFSKVNWTKENTSNGNSSGATSNGDSSGATSNGYSSGATSNGNNSGATSNGYSSGATSNGDNSGATSNGNRSGAMTCGDNTFASTVKGGVATVIGKDCKAKGSIGAWLVITEGDYDKDFNFFIKDLKSIKVDGKKIKADTFYKLVNGKFIETI